MIDIKEIIVANVTGIFVLIVAFLTRMGGKKENRIGGNEADAKRLTDLVKGAVRKFNETAKKPYVLKLSMGSAICNKKGFDANLFLHRMDEKMYEHKASHYQKKKELQETKETTETNAIPE